SVGDTGKQSSAQQENEQRTSNTPEEKEQRVSDISEEMQTESAAVTEMQTESEVMAENQAEAFAEGADAPGRKKKIPVWVKVCVLIFAMAAALAGYCFHRFSSGETSGETDIKRMDSRETKEAALGSGGISVPCDFKRIHLTGEVSLGEITIEVYDAANIGTTARTADGVPVWEPEPGVVPVFRQTYRAGAVIDETVEIHAEPGSVHCAYTLIIRQPTNMDVEAVVYRADEAGYYGWQEIISSNRFAWLRKLLHLERLGEDEVMRQYGS
ncbi:MAG: hypothetical protein K2G89_03730, partial [Lachnospiraceae bacterium]|nr:hypothetical protein [Lachnospiraceae bacterium]